MVFKRAENQNVAGLLASNLGLFAKLTQLTQVAAPSISPPSFALDWRGRSD